MGNGQGIFGGFNGHIAQTKIYHMTCVSGECKISKLYRELSVPRGYLLVVPVPDSISGFCAEGKYLHKVLNQ